MHDAAEMAGCDNSSSENPWLVILNISLAESELHRLLKMQQVRIKGLANDLVGGLGGDVVFLPQSLDMKIECIPNVLYSDVLLTMAY